MESFPIQLDDCPTTSVSLWTMDGDSLTMWGCDTAEVKPSGELKTQVGPDRALVIGRQNGGETSYLDPRYRPSPLAPNTGRSILSNSKRDVWVSRGHFMLKGSPTGVVLVNGVPQRGGGIRPPLNGTWLVAPECRSMEQGEEYLIQPGAFVKISLPNGTVILINAD